MLFAYSITSAINYALMKLKILNYNSFELNIFFPNYYKITVFGPKLNYNIFNILFL